MIVEPTDPSGLYMILIADGQYVNVQLGWHWDNELMSKAVEQMQKQLEVVASAKQVKDVLSKDG